MATPLLRSTRSHHNHHRRLIRWSTTVTTTTKPSHHKEHANNQEYLTPNPIIGSWTRPKTPEQAQTQLALLRREYAKEVKGLRKQYIYEMEVQRQEKLRKDEVRKVEILKAREERNLAKSAAARARAVEREQFEEEFRRTLMKEREDKLNYWRKREEAIEERKNSAKEQLRRQSSLWIDEKELETKIIRTVVDTIRL